MSEIKVPPSHAKLPKKFIDWDGKGEDAVPAPTLANARIALGLFGLSFSHNLFTGKKYVGGIALNTDVGGQVTDDSVSMLRLMMREHFRFDPGLNNTWQAVNVFCREHPFHPIKDYLEGLKWDGTPRIETMLIDYFGAPDTPFVRGVSGLVMIASVRRIYQPGCKFDYMTVLESPEGYAKSSALAALYGAEFFSDQTIIGLSDKELAEAVRGRWGIECADLGGMRKAEVEKTKAQLSRFEDRTRPAYGRAVIDTPRSCVMWGTTNEEEYLRSQTGNRRFLPIRVTRAVNLEGIKRDRDQLWAEAYAVEPLVDSILLPEELWAAAGKEQEQRTFQDAWLDTLATASEVAADHERSRGHDSGGLLGHNGAPIYEVRERGDGVAVERIASGWLMTSMLCIPMHQQNAENAKRLGMVMRKLGWNGPSVMKIGGKSQRGYERETFA